MDFVIGAPRAHGTGSDMGAAYMFTDLQESTIDIVPAFNRIKLDSLLDVRVAIGIQGIDKPDAALAGKQVELHIANQATLFGTTDDWGEYTFSSVSGFNVEGDYTMFATWPR